MTQDTLWIGTTSKFVEVPLPELPLDAALSGYGEEMRFENGGQAVAGSFGQARRYEFNYPLVDSGELGLLRRIRQGSFGDGLVFFSDPMAQRLNLFSPVWAEPGLLEVGDWPDIYDTAPSFSNVAANSYGQPLRKATFTVTNTNTAPGKQFVIPIPPDQTLHVGVSGAATGIAIVRVTAHNIAAGSSATTNLTLLPETGSTRLNASFAGSSYDYVTVDFRRTSSAASTLTVTSMLAQLWPTGVTPTLTGDHVPGEGHTGCRFAGDLWSESYRVASDDGVRLYKSAAFSLVETGAWE